VPVDDEASRYERVSSTGYRGEAKVFVRYRGRLREVEVLEFKHSGYKLVGHGTYRVRLPNGFENKYTQDDVYLPR
jgi:hypothetical protein